MCVYGKRFRTPPLDAPTMTTRKAHEIKPGDRIHGTEVFDTIRRTFGGFYIPMVDGSRIEVPNLDAPVTTD